MISTIMFSVLNILILIMMTNYGIKTMKKENLKPLKNIFETKVYSIYHIFTGVMAFAAVIMVFAVIEIIQNPMHTEAMAEVYKSGKITLILLSINQWIISLKRFVIAEEGLFFEHRFGFKKRVCTFDMIKAYGISNDGKVNFKYKFDDQNDLNLQVLGKLSEEEKNQVEAIMKKKKINKMK